MNHFSNTDLSTKIYVMTHAELAKDEWHNKGLDPKAVSELTGIPTATLATWRCRNLGPPFMKLGGHVRYRQGEVHKWMLANEQDVSI